MSTTKTSSGFGDPIVLSRHKESSEMSGPGATLQSALADLSDGRISEVVELFADHFTFNDHALTLELKGKRHLTEFFEKSREVFPDSTFELGSMFDSGDRAIAEWRLSATESVPLGSISHRVPISLQGSTIICVENGKIVQWSEYCDQGNPTAGMDSWLRLKLGSYLGGRHTAPRRWLRGKQSNSGRSLNHLRLTHEENYARSVDHNSSHLCGPRGTCVELRPRDREQSSPRLARWRRRRDLL
jgi:hypothetical protein